MLRESTVSTTPQSDQRSKPTVEVSWGELIDKVTILEIKTQRLTSPTAVDNVRRELAVLSAVMQGLDFSEELAGLKRQLTTVNETLWDVEDDIRAKEAAGAFDKEFVELARAVYFSNDKRADLKRKINLLLNSGLIEEKQYTAYEPTPAKQD